MKLGIDLGTTYSMVAHQANGSVPALVPDAHDASQFQTPSVVHIGPEGALVGQVVEDLLDDESSLPVARFVKLKMGSSEVAFEDHLGRAWGPESISALVLRKLLQDVAAFHDERVDGALITIPAQFDDAQRRATRDAAGLAGIRNVALLEEPVAAAAHHGFKQGREQTLFVYDLGGGTFDATVVQVSPDGLYVLATEGSNEIGGKHFDDLLMQRVIDNYRCLHGEAPPQDEATEHELRRISERMKISLSRPGRAQVRQPVLLGGKPLEVSFSRGQLEGLLAPLLDTASAVTERCLAGCGLSWSAIDRVLLVGGSTHYPLVRDRLLTESGLPRDQVVQKQPHQAVVYGAAMLAEGMLGESGAAVAQGISSRELGLRTWNKHDGRAEFETLIKRNAPLPAECTRTFYTTRADQRRLVLELLQRKGPESEPSSLGIFEFGPIHRPRKNYPVEVTVAYDLEGIVKVVARDRDTGTLMETTVQDGTMVSSAKLAAQSELLSGLTINL